jgi:hypothetical protein
MWDKKKRGKRGISIVTILIFLFLVLVVVIITWVIVKNIIEQDAEQTELEKSTPGLNIKSVKVEEGGNVIVMVGRNPGEENFVGMNFIFSDGQESETIREDTSLNESEERNFTFTLTKISTENLQNVSVAPIYESASGEENIGVIGDSFESFEDEVDEVDGGTEEAEYILDDCEFFSNSTFRSVNKYEGGLMPNGSVEMIYWNIYPKGGNMISPYKWAGELDWAYSDVIEGGSYICQFGILRAEFFDYSIFASYDADREILMWDTVEFGYWEVRLRGEEFDWVHADMVERGSYTCSNNALQATSTSGGPTIIAIYNWTQEILTWDGIEYKEPVSPGYTPPDDSDYCELISNSTFYSIEKLDIGAKFPESYMKV